MKQVRNWENELWIRIIGLGGLLIQYNVRLLLIIIHYDRSGRYKTEGGESGILSIDVYYIYGRLAEQFQVGGW